MCCYRRYGWTIKLYGTCRQTICMADWDRDWSAGWRHLKISSKYCVLKWPTIYTTWCWALLSCLRKTGHGWQFTCMLHFLACWRFILLREIEIFSTLWTIKIWQWTFVSNFKHYCHVFMGHIIFVFLIALHPSVLQTDLMQWLPLNWWEVSHIQVTREVWQYILQWVVVFKYAFLLMYCK